MITDGRDKIKKGARKREAGRQADGILLTVSDRPRRDVFFPRIETREIEKEQT